MGKLKVSVLSLLIGAGLVGSSFGLEMEDPYIPAMTGMIKNLQEEQKTVKHEKEVKQIDSKPKEDIKAESTKEPNVKKDDG